MSDIVNASPAPSRKEKCPDYYKCYTLPFSLSGPRRCSRTISPNFPKHSPSPNQTAENDQLPRPHEQCFSVGRQPSIFCTSESKQ